jgi:hypothetical protein
MDQLLDRSVSAHASLFYLLQDKKETGREVEKRYPFKLGVYPSVFCRIVRKAHVSLSQLRFSVQHNFTYYGIRI